MPGGAAGRFWCASKSAVAEITCAMGARKVRLRLAQRQSRVRVIDDDEHIPALDLLAVHHLHLGNRSVDLGGDERHFGGRVSVVGLT